MAAVCVIARCLGAVSVAIRVDGDEFLVCDRCASRIKKAVAEHMANKVLGKN